jgi:3-deoxy-manno-octulosonate cytidylyltransferase (CMP-KDO synthetase)
MPQNIVAIIPARYQSTRFPGKPLAFIGDKAMIERVYEQTLKVEQLTKVLVATDDERISEHCIKKGIDVVMTSVNHLNGTTRCLEVANSLSLEENDIVINVQGDEPFISPKQIGLLLLCFNKSEVEIASLCKKIIDDVENSNTVKVVKNIFSEALYFSRSKIPFIRDNEFVPSYYKHIGLYAFRYSTLKKIVLLNESELEKSEKLEQLRWLENGFRVHLSETYEESISVDTEADLINAIDYAKSFDSIK